MTACSALVRVGDVTDDVNGKCWLGCKLAFVKR